MEQRFQGLLDTLDSKAQAEWYPDIFITDGEFDDLVAWQTLQSIVLRRGKKLRVILQMADESKGFVKFWKAKKAKKKEDVDRSTGRPYIAPTRDALKFVEGQRWTKLAPDSPDFQAQLSTFFGGAEDCKVAYFKDPMVDNMKNAYRYGPTSQGSLAVASRTFEGMIGRARFAVGDVTAAASRSKLVNAASRKRKSSGRGRAPSPPPPVQQAPVRPAATGVDIYKRPSQDPRPGEGRYPGALLTINADGSMVQVGNADSGGDSSGVDEKIEEVDTP
jgi:hypothetical protein